MAAGELEVAAEFNAKDSNGTAWNLLFCCNNLFISVLEVRDKCCIWHRLLSHLMLHLTTDVRNELRLWSQPTLYDILLMVIIHEKHKHISVFGLSKLCLDKAPAFQGKLHDNLKEHEGQL